MNGFRASERVGAWTLAEVLMAMGIVIVLSSGVGLAGHSQIERARSLAANQQIARIELALESFYTDLGRYPTELEGLQALVEPPLTTAGSGNWRGPYLDERVPDDPWGDGYRYRLVRRAGVLLPEVFSSGGPDAEVAR